MNTSLIYASGLRRFAAACYDSFILLALLMAVTAILLIPSHGHAIPAGNVFYQCVLMLIIGCFYTYFWHKKGQTVGMLAWRCQLAHQDGSLMTYREAWLRYVVLLTSLLCCGLGVFWCLIDKQHRTWQDIAAGTFLFKRKKDESRKH